MTPVAYNNIHFTKDSIAARYEVITRGSIQTHEAIEGTHNEAKASIADRCPTAHKTMIINRNVTSEKKILPAVVRASTAHLDLKKN